MKKGVVTQFSLLLVSVLVGLMLAIQMQSLKQPRAEDARDLLQIRSEILAQQLRHQELSSEIFHMQLLLQQYQQATSSEGEFMEVMKRQLEEVRRAAGLTPLEGKGLLITVDVLPREDFSQMLEARQSALTRMIDDDIRNLIDELFANGAEAVSFNGLRLVTHSTITKADQQILVNETPVTLPFEIHALGNPDLLQAALEVSEIPDIYMDLGLQMKFDKQENLTVPAYHVQREIEYMQRQEESDS